MNWDPKQCLYRSCQADLQGVIQSGSRESLSLNTSSDINIDCSDHPSSAENICESDLATISNSVVGECNWRPSVWANNYALLPCDYLFENSPGGFACSLEESFQVSSAGASSSLECPLIPEERTYSSSFSSPSKGGDMMDSSAAEDSGYGLQAEELANDLSLCNLSSSTECGKLSCREVASANRHLVKKLHEYTMQLGVKDASLARLKDAITHQFLEKEDILQQKIKSETDLRACKQQLETTRKSEIHFRDNLYESEAELNTLRREHLFLQGEIASNKILSNKLDVEKMQINSLRDKSYPRENAFVAEPSFDVQTCYQEQLGPPLEEKVLQLEKKMEKLQDDTEDLTFKAQRHEEEAASLCSQNAQLVKKCSDLQRQLVECLSTVDVLDVRCNDAESKLERVRKALEEKENALLILSNKHTAALVQLEENEREMDRVRTEMDTVASNFSKISCNQRELKEDLLFYKTLLRKRDLKIQQLKEDRKSIAIFLEKLKDKVPCTCKDGNNSVNIEVNSYQPLSEPWAGQSDLLMRNISVGDDLMVEQMRIVKSENERLAGQVKSLTDELENRCAFGVLKMNRLMETIETLENDMNHFLSTVEQKAEPRGISMSRVEQHADGEPHAESRELAREFSLKENSELTQKLAKAKEEVQALRRANHLLEEETKKQTFWLDAVLQGQAVGARQTALEKLADLKVRRQKGISIEPLESSAVSKELETMEQEMKLGISQGNDELRTLLETKVVLLENANNELVMYIDSLHRSVGNESCGQFWLKSRDAVDLLSLTRTGTIELYRISVLLHVCMLKAKSIVPRDKAESYRTIIYGLEGLLSKVRSVITGDGSSNASNEQVMHPVVTLPVKTSSATGAPVAEPNVLVACNTELEIHLAVNEKNNHVLRDPLALSEEERRKEQKRRKIQLYDLMHKIKLRLKENRSNVPISASDPTRDGNRAVKNSSSSSEHRVCVDMIVNLQRSLRASESANAEMQKQLRAKTEETWKLNQEIANLRFSLETVNDILDNKKIALGRSEAMGQMLKVSEASLEQRLELEQRQHEDCTLQLDKLAALLEETRTRSEDINELRRQLAEKEKKLSAICNDYNEAINEQEILLQRCREKDRELEHMQNEIREGIDLRKRFSLIHKTEARNDFPSIEDNTILLSPSPAPAPIITRTKIDNVLERAKLPRSDVMRLLNDCVSHMSEDLNFLQHHLEKNRGDNAPVFKSK